MDFLKAYNAPRPVQSEFQARAASAVSATMLPPATKPPLLVSTSSNAFLDVVMEDVEDPDQERDAVKNVRFNFLPGWSWLFLMNILAGDYGDAYT